MINKENWAMIKKYLDYRKRIDQIAPGSLKVEQTYLRYALYWIGEKPFSKASAYLLTLPEFLLVGRFDGVERKLKPAFIKKILAAARRFFMWLVENEPGYRLLKRSWIDSLKVKRLTDVPINTEAVSLDEVMVMARAPAVTIEERRIRAAAVMLFLSGMRIGAFVSLPIRAVDIEGRCIKQFPSLGVRTKNGKHGVTYLLDIPELMPVVRAWDQEVRALLPLEGFWFAPLSPETGEIDTHCLEIGEHRSSIARKNLKEWLARVELLYHSPHKFRHGHIHYGLAHAKVIADFKAISQNALHSSIDVTDQFYSNQADQDVKNRISALGKVSSSFSDEDFALFQQFMTWQKSMTK